MWSMAKPQREIQLSMDATIKSAIEAVKKEMTENHAGRSSLASGLVLECPGYRVTKFDRFDARAGFGHSVTRKPGKKLSSFSSF
jgi:hypothetical protein